MTFYGFKDEVAPWTLILYVDLLLIIACGVWGCYIGRTYKKFY